MGFFKSLKGLLSKKRFWIPAVLIVLLFFVFTSSTVKIILQALRPPDLPALQVSLDTKPVTLSQNWSAEDASKYHHINQGTRTLPIPYKWFINLERPRSFLPGVLFSSDKRLVDDEYLLRFGFIQGETTPDNPDGLPIGFARSFSQNLPGITEKTEAVGFTCAACHTGHLQYEGTQYLIEGGPAMTDIGLLTSSLGASLGQTALSSKIPFFNGRFDRFAKRVLEEEYSPSTRKLLKDEIAQLIEHLAGSGGDIIEVTEGFTRLDALNRIGNQVFSAEANRRENYAPVDAPVNYPHIWTASWFDWVQYDGSIMGPLIRNTGEALGVSAYVDMQSPPGQNRYASSIPLNNLVWLEQLLAGEEPLPNKKFSGLLSPKWPAAFPQPDPVKVERGEALYKKHCQGCHLPALNSDEIWTEDYFKPIAYIKDGQRYETNNKPLKLNVIPLSEIGTDPAQSDVLAHRTVNTGTIKEGDKVVKEALGVHADVCSPDVTGRAYLDAWPADEAPYPEGVKERYNLPDQDDGHRRNYYSSPLTYEPVRDGTTTSFGAALAAVVQQTIDAWFNQHHVEDPAIQGLYEGDRPNCIQAGAGYKARPLNGVWATAPFLHNGSVPTLMAMLSPDERPTYVQLGRLDFDAEHAGLAQPDNYEANAKRHLAKGEVYDDEGFFILDTTKPGNSNRGHEFRDTYDDTKNYWEQPPGVIGPALSLEDREAIVAYLKTL